MARPQDKISLMNQAHINYEKMVTLISTLTEEQQVATFAFEDRDRNIRDILIHLYEWHQLLLNWVSSNHAKNTPAPFLLSPYNWKTYGEMNIEFWQKHQDTPLEESKIWLEKSHQDVLNLIEQFTDEELFQKKYFPWTGTTSLGSYCVSATSSHYDWAIKKIKRYIKSIA